jgi:hypothetical protein
MMKLARREGQRFLALLPSNPLIYWTLNSRLPAVPAAEVFATQPLNVALSPRLG